MSTTAPPPNSTPTAVPPTSPSSPPPPVSPLPPVSPTTQPNATPPDSSPPPPVQTPPPQSPPPAVPATPPPSIVSPPPPTVASPPPTTSSPPPVVSSPPPTNSEPPPPPSDPPKSSPSPPPPSDPPKSSPSPPPPSDPPKSSPSPPPPSDLPPPPTSTPPVSSPPPPTPIPPKSSPPPSTPKPPESSPPPPSIDPPTSSPPPPKATPPTSSPPPPKTQPPTNSPPPPQESKPPVSSPPPPTATPPKISPPTPTSPPPSKLSPPSPPIKGQPPTSDLTPPSSPSPPTPSQASVPPSGLASPANAQISTAAVAGISAVLGLIVLGLAGLLVWCIVKRKRKASGYNAGYIMPSPYASSLNSGSSFLKGHSSAPLVGSASGSDSIPSPGLGNSRPWFTYEELFVATNGFSEQNLLGEGGFGCVYKGCLPDGRVVAVKQLKIGGGQGEREFKAEVEIISRIHHRHLVSLVGYCISDSRRLLIYEFVPNDTLYFHLHGKDRPVMDWAMRVKVAAGAARGIAYLHEDCHPRIIHRDIKSSNILLGANFEARVSDFGLAKLAADADTHITTRIMGTFGYMAPEYASSGKLTDKSDVYSFGVVLLEMITGRKPVDASQPLGDESLVEWARPLLSDALETQQFDRIVDPRLEKNYVESEMFLMVEAAAACVRHSSAKRPRMSQVVRALDSVTASDLSNGMKPGESEVYDSAEQSAEIRLFQRMAFGSQNYSTDFFSQSSMMNNKATISEKIEPHESADRS